MAECVNLKKLLDLSLSEFLEIDGIGEAKAVQVMAALELGKRAVSEKNGNNVSFRCSEEVANYYIPLLKDLKKEQFRVLLLDIKNKVIKEVLISQGSLTSSVARLVTLFFDG
jgi:DNA repair protein RadC